MANTSQQLGQQFGVNVTPTPAPAPPTTATEEDKEIELRTTTPFPSGFLFDPTIEDTRERGPLFGLEFLKDVPILGDLPPNLAQAEEDPRIRPKSEKLREEYRARITKSIEELGGTFDPRGVEVKDILGNTALGSQGLATFGFAETAEEARRAFEKVHGEGNVRVFEDTERGTLAPQFYISLRKDDGTFTPYASPVQSAVDYGRMLSGSLSYDVAAGSGTVGTAFAGAAVMTASLAGTGPIAPFIGGLTFAYLLYAGGGTTEKFKQEVLKDQIGLTDKDADEAETLLGQVYDTLNRGYTPDKPYLGLYGDEFTDQEKMAGNLELLLGVPGGIATKLRLTLGRRGQAFLEDTASMLNIYPSARAAQEASIATKARPGSDAAKVDGTDFTLIDEATGQQVTLGGMTLKSVTDSRIISRLSGLAEQTSVIIPRKLRESAQSAVNYLKTYKNNLGEGDFGLFRKNLNDMQEYFSKYRDKTPAFKDLGMSIQELDKLFRTLRFDEAKGLYAKVFDTVGTSSYNMGPAVDKIIANTRTIVPGLDDAGKRTGSNLQMQPGEPNLFDAIEAVKGLGSKEAGGVLTYQGMDAAIAAFNKANPAYAISRTSKDYTIDSPAKLLHMFATRFGEMASDLAALPNPSSASRNARSTAMEMRETLLDMIGNPEGVDDAVKASIRNDLNDANAFYKETYDIVEKAQTRTKTKVLKYTEPGQFSRDILSKGNNVATEELLEALGKQQDYVMANLARADVVNNPAALTNLQASFKELVDMNIALSMPGKAGEKSSPTALRDFLGNFSDDELATLGYGSAAKEQALRDADQLAELASGDFVAVVGKNAAANSPFLLRFQEVFSNPTRINDNLSKLITVAERETAGAGMENLRKGFFDYLVSTQSGVLRRVKENTAYSRVGDYEIDFVRLGEILDQSIEVAPNLSKILNEKDMAVLTMLQSYTATLGRAGADAGSALSGAQIIGELFTIDPLKLGRGLARLGAQKRIATLFTNDELVNVAVGLGAKEVGSTKSTILNYFFGPAAVGTIVANIATGESPEAAETRRMLENEGVPTSPTVDALMEQFTVN